MWKREKIIETPTPVENSWENEVMIYNDVCMNVLYLYIVGTLGGGLTPIDLTIYYYLNYYIESLTQLFLILSFPFPPRSPGARRLI